MKFKLLSFIVCTLFMLTACSSNENPSETSNSSASTESSQSQQSSNGILSVFSAEDLNGNALNQDILKEKKLTMVNVWATFCTPCISEMPDLGELSEEYSDKGVQIIGIISDVLASDGSVDSEQISLAKDIVSSTSANYTHIVPSEDLYPLLAQISSVPTTFFVDENGNQVGSGYLGAKSKDDWKKIIDEILTEVS